MSVKKKIKSTIKEIWRFPIKVSMRRRLRIKNVRIISSMCTGGMLSHDLGLAFQSPTINLTIPKFVDFCEDIEKNINASVESCGISSKGYPLAKVGGILIQAIHYSSFDDFKRQWERRVARFNSSADEIVLMATDNQVVGKDEIERFHALPYRKVCFTSRKDIPYPEFVYIPEYGDLPQVGDVLRYGDLFGTMLFEKHFDCVGWLNGASPLGC